MGQRVETSEKEIQQLNSVLETQLDRMNAQIFEYEKTNDENIQKVRQQTAGFFAELEQLIDQVQRLNGQIEESNYAFLGKTEGIENQLRILTEKLKEIETSSQSNTDRIAGLEQYLDFESSDKLGASAVSDNLDRQTSSDSALYKRAKLAFDRSEFEDARKGFQQLLKQFPSSSNADNAQFWIGEIYFKEKWYEKAILEYQKVIEDYPKGNKVPSALLKQGLAFNQLGDRKNCRLILQELIDRYPKTPESGIAKKRLNDFK